MRMNRIILASHGGLSAGMKDTAVSYTHLDVYKRQLFGCGDRAGGVAHLADAVHDCNFHCAFHKMTSVFICLLTFIKCL